MLKLACRHCKAVLCEAEERWARVARTGMRPECSWFYDEAKELEAQRLATDPKVVSDTRAVKLHELTLGGIATTAALLSISFFLLLFQATGQLVIVAALGFLLVFGIRTLLHGLLYDPRREARSRLARPTDLRMLAERQAERGACDGNPHVGL